MITVALIAGLAGLWIGGCLGILICCIVSADREPAPRSLDDELADLLR